MDSSSHKGKKPTAHPRKWPWKNYLKKVWKFCNHGAVAALLGVLATYAFDVLKRPSIAPIEALMKREAELAGGSYPHPDKELEEYVALFADDAIVLDYRSGDVWKGHTAIIDRLRPLHFATLHHSTSGEIQIDGNDASAQTKTAFMQDKPTIVPGVGKENWQFRKINGHWRILSLQYDLPP
jgi:hypothetical protein